MVGRNTAATRIHKSVASCLHWCMVQSVCFCSLPSCSWRWGKGDSKSHCFKLLTCTAKRGNHNSSWTAWFITWSSASEVPERRVQGFPQNWCRIPVKGFQCCSSLDRSETKERVECLLPTEWRRLLLQVECGLGSPQMKTLLTSLSVRRIWWNGPYWLKQSGRNIQRIRQILQWEWWS